MAKKRIKKLEGADARYGWELGCEGYVSALGAARMIGKSHSRVCDWINDDGRKTPGHPGYPIRAGRPPNAGKLTPWKVCIRSLREYQKLQQPIEV